MSLSFVIPEFNIGQTSPDLSPQFIFYRRGFNLNGSNGGGGWTDIILKGNTALTLVNAKANGLNYLKLFGGTEQRNLPAGHTQLEYVYMTSGSFIKIEDLLINSGYRVEYEFQTTTLGSSLRNYLGGRASGVSAGGGFRLSKLASGGTALNRVVLYGFETGTEFYDPTAQFQPNTRYKYTYDNGVCTLESGGSVVSTQTFTVTDNTSTKWGINTYVSNNDYWQTDSADGIYGYSLKVWNEQGELVMDLVPDLTSSNVVCYYDMVTGNIREASAGTFEAGTIAPTPTTPVNIISNNGAIKYSANMCNVNEQTALIGYYISASGVVTADANNWIYQDFIPVKPNTTYTLSISTPVYYVTISEYSTTDDSGFIRRNASGGGENTAFTITTGSTTNYVRFGANIYRGEVTLNTVLAINWMLNVGDTMAYQPYIEGGIYTDGTVETVEVTGQNLLDLTNCVDGHYYSADGVYSDAESARLSNFVKVKANESYTIFAYGLKGQANVRVNLFDTNKTWLSQQVKSSTLDKYMAITVTATQDGYLAFSANFATTGSCIDWTLSQIIKGSYTVEQMPEYKPYFSDTAIAEMLLKVGDYKDEQNVTNGHITRNVGVMVFDGSENWVSAGTGSSLRCHITYDIGLPDTDTLTSPMVCSHYQFGGYISGGGATTQGTFNAFSRRTEGDEAYYLRFSIVGMGISSASGFKQWLKAQYNAGTPVTIVYPLATATTESVAHQHLSIQAGTNTIGIIQACIDNLELEVSYKGKEGE
jgi:hypothetical protein